jgi:hypothetical protein
MPSCGKDVVDITVTEILREIGVQIRDAGIDVRADWGSSPCIETMTGGAAREEVFAALLDGGPIVSVRAFCRGSGRGRTIVRTPPLARIRYKDGSCCRGRRGRRSQVVPRLKWWRRGRQSKVQQTLRRSDEPFWGHLDRCRASLEARAEYGREAVGRRSEHYGDDSAASYRTTVFPGHVKNCRDVNYDGKQGALQLQ